jgi:hypothetical protein
MAINVSKITESISEIIAKEIEKTLGRLKTKIFESAEIKESEYPIDLTKFTQNTVKKIVESKEFIQIMDNIKESSNEEKKEKKEKKDPDAPKGAKNAFIFFCNEKRNEVKKANPDLKATEITKKMAEMWKEEADKEPYQNMAKKDKERYTEELGDYEPKEGFKNPKKSKEVKTAPKRALSAYIFFTQAKRDEVKKSNPSMKSSEIMSELGKLWKGLSDKKKKPYEKLAEEDKERYAEDMKNYVPSEEEKAKKSKKEKKVSSKRSPSAYLLFCKDNRDKVKNANPEKKTTEITTILGKMWTDLSEKKKKPYVEKAEKLKEEFKKENKEVEVEEEVKEVEEDEEDEEVEEDEEDDDESILSDDEDEVEEVKEPVKKSKNRTLPSFDSKDKKSKKKF